MKKQISGVTVAKNVILSVGVQAVSVIVGFILNLVVPKFISEYDYSYWQTYLLYSQYVGVLHFGLLDSIVLRYSQYDYDELDKTSVRSQYLAVMAIDVFFAVGLPVVAFCFVTDTVSRVLVILLSITIFVEITYNYVSFTFQITNRIKEYAKYIICYRLIYCVLILLELVTGRKEYFWFCIAYLAADILAIVYFGFRYSRELFWGKPLPVKQLLPELKETLSAGIWLMIASYAATFLIGSGKMVIQWFWDTLTFGKVSLAFSLSSFVLQFVTAISVVLFPSIKRMKADALPGMYSDIRSAISPLLFIALIFYYPGCAILEVWLPKYSESLVYLGILMPVIVYSSKVSLLTNNYLKAYRRERQLLMINASIVLSGFMIFLLCGYVLHNLYLLLVMVVIMIIARSIVSEFAVIRIIGGKMVGDLILELILTFIFIISTICFNRWVGCGIYGIMLLIYLIIKRKSIGRIGRILKKGKVQGKGDHEGAM